MFAWFQNRKKKAVPTAPPPPPVPLPPEETDGLTPDSPIPFGYKTGWLCIQSGDPQAVLEALGLRGAAPCNWGQGLDRVDRAGMIFVSPSLDGWVLVVGWFAEDLADLLAVARTFPRFQYFASHRVSDYYVWARFEGGALLRAYAFAGDDGVFWDEGELTPEEAALGGARFPRKGSEPDWDTTEFPDEETVLALAAAWGVDTGFSGKEYPPALGWLGQRARQ